MSHDRIHAKIEAFLAEHRQSEGGWAKVTEGDMQALDGILSMLIALKFDKDPDGDLPVEYELIDRTRFEPMDFMRIPYIHNTKPDTGEERRMFGLLMANLHMAMGQLERLVRHMDLERRIAEEDKNRV